MNTPHPVLKKMSYKGEKPVAVINAPDSFKEIMQAFEGEVLIDRTPCPMSFFFAVTLEDLKSWGDYVRALPEGDLVIWIAYPKKSSKKYTAEFTRDLGWEHAGEIGCEPVRMIAIDADWSALRFRRTQYIKKLTRRNSMALSAEGKKRTQGN